MASTTNVGSAAARAWGSVTTRTRSRSAPSAFSHAGPRRSAARRAESSERTHMTTSPRALTVAASPQAIVPLPAMPSRSSTGARGFYSLARPGAAPFP